MKAAIIVLGVIAMFGGAEVFGQTAIFPAYWTIGWELLINGDESEVEKLEKILEDECGNSHSCRVELRDEMLDKWFEDKCGNSHSCRVDIENKIKGGGIDKESSDTLALIGLVAVSSICIVGAVFGSLITINKSRS